MQQTFARNHTGPCSTRSTQVCPTAAVALKPCATTVASQGASQLCSPFSACPSASVSHTAFGRSKSWAFGTGSFASRTVKCRATAAPPVGASPKLIELPLLSLINTMGVIAPEVPEGAKQAVYAIYDDKQRLQFIGFAPDLRSALRTALGRRPDKAYYYRATFLDNPDLEAGAAVREAWFEQCGGAPKGNKMAMERTAWTQPVDAGAISERGKRGAAEQTAKTLIAAIRDRGCKEDFTPMPGLMDQGLVDFLSSAGLSEEEMEAHRSEALAKAANCRTVTALVDGMDKKFLVMYKMKLATRGGFMVDVVMNADHKETLHRVIVGKDYYEPMGLPVEAAVEAALCVLLANKLQRHTDGILDSATFPVNYFSMSEMDQWFGEALAAEFARVTGAELADEETRARGFWRFNRIHDYNAMRQESPEQIK